MSDFNTETTEIESMPLSDIHLGDGFDDPEFIEAFQTALGNLPGRTTTSLDNTLGETNDLGMLEGVMVRPYFEPKDTK